MSGSYSFSSNAMAGAAPSYVAPPDFNAMVPQVGSATDWVKAGLQANSALPEDLQITSNVLPDQQRQRYEQGYLDQYVRPQIEQLSAGLFRQGRADSSFGGAQLGAAQAQGAYQGMMAGEQLYQNRLNQLIAKRASFYGNEGQMAQTSNLKNVERGMNLANLAERQNESQNQFNLGAYNANVQAQGQFGNQQLDWARFNQDRAQQQWDNNFKQQQMRKQDNANAWRLGANAASAGAGMAGAAAGSGYGQSIMRGVGNTAGVLAGGMSALGGGIFSGMQKILHL